MRSSVRFSAVSHAEFVAKANVTKKKEETLQSRQYTFTISAAISFWD